jgi:hypothetical protein
MVNSALIEECGYHNQHYGADHQIEIQCSEPGKEKEQCGDRQPFHIFPVPALLVQPVLVEISEVATEYGDRVCHRALDGSEVI